jgi:hypothetical protein
MVATTKRKDRMFQEWDGSRAYFAQVFGPIPEPATIWLLLAGVFAAWALRRRSNPPAT